MPPLLKKNLSIPFGQGLDTKSDPWQVPPGKMLALQNTVFNKFGLLEKRNGFGRLTGLTDSTVNTLATFIGSLTAIGQAMYSLSPSTATWFNKGPIAPITTAVNTLTRSSGSQTGQDVAVTPGGLACTVWADSDGFSKYQITETTTNTVLVSSTSLPATATNARAFILGRFFIITFLVTVTATPYLRFIAIPILTPTVPGLPQDISTNVSSLSAGYDGLVINNALYISWDSATLGGSVKTTYIDTALLVHTPVDMTGQTADYVSIAADTSSPTPTVWVTFWNSADNKLCASAFSNNLVPILAPTNLLTNANNLQITSLAESGVLTVVYQTQNDYSYDTIRSDYLSIVTCTIAGVVGSPAVLKRSVGLASKAFANGDKNYVTVAYGGSFQPTYFLIDFDGNIVAKLAYGNGGGYASTQVLPGVNTLSTGEVAIGYLFKATLTAVNKSQGVANTAGVYAQLGVNLVKWGINLSPSVSSEIGSNLHITGGFPWMYDGVKPVEHSFHVWPEDVETTPATSGGSMIDQQYYYQVTYEWTDAQGNLHRSAPSVPTGALVSGGGGSGSVTLDIPTLRLTYKIAPNPVRIVIYRWSTAQQNYYQITSIVSPLLNNPSVDSVQYVDMAADTAILGNQLIYTTGGVVENIAGPACSSFTLFRSRLWLIDAEDPNLLWYSKVVIEGTPVELFDGFTVYVAPTAGAQGSTGPTKCIASMDDKLIMFKQDALYYMTGLGPDNTGAQNDFSEPIFVTATAGSSNPQSIVMTPVGLMFQSDKGIWILRRDLTTEYIGAPVAQYNDSTVLSAISVPGTNQVRFTLDNGVTLMYDYFFNEWGTFNNVPAIASTLYQGLHTYVNQYGQVFQETVGSYLDGSNPVLMSFTSAWMSLAGLQGFERAYYFYLLGKYLTPHKLNIQIAYDFNPNPVQSVLITPDNFAYTYGEDPGPYGSQDTYGGNSDPEQWRIFLERQKCQSFQLSITEVYDPSFGVAAGAGFTLSGLNLIAGVKKGYTTIKAANSAG